MRWLSCKYVVLLALRLSPNVQIPQDISKKKIMHGISTELIPVEILKICHSPLDGYDIGYDTNKGL